MNPQIYIAHSPFDFLNNLYFLLQNQSRVWVPDLEFDVLKKFFMVQENLYEKPKQAQGGKTLDYIKLEYLGLWSFEGKVLFLDKPLNNSSKNTCKNKVFNNILQNLELLTKTLMLIEINLDKTTQDLLLKNKNLLLIKK